MSIEQSNNLYYNQQNNNIHPLYIEQQQWLAQFKQPLPQNQQYYQSQQQQQSYGTPHFAQLQSMGFCDHKKNYRLLKRYNWNVDQVVQSLKDQNETRQHNTELNIIQIISNTKILYIDCNNIKYACHQWNQFRGQPKKQIKNVLKIILVWIQMTEQLLDEVHLIWDVYKMNKIEKIRQKLSKFEPFKYFHELRQEDKITTFKILNNQKFINFSIQSAYPDIADDLIVKLCFGQNNSQTSVVTSDKGLRIRLQELGVTQFIGNGRWWKLKDELTQQAYRIFTRLFIYFMQYLFYVILFFIFQIINSYISISFKESQKQIQIIAICQTFNQQDQFLFFSHFFVNFVELKFQVSTTLIISLFQFNSDEEYNIEILPSIILACMSHNKMYKFDNIFNKISQPKLIEQVIKNNNDKFLIFCRMNYKI